MGKTLHNSDVSGARMNYLTLLEHSFDMQKANRECPPESRLAFLSEDIFDFTTYDGEMDNLFGRKAIEVCAAINNRTTFDYIKDPESYRWFLLMCNMPFFYPRLSWGTSIRGAWWDVGGRIVFEVHSCGLWDGNEQLLDLHFGAEEWAAFMQALVDFTADEMKPNVELT